MPEFIGRRRLAFAAVLAAAFTAGAADWPEWRGLNRAAVWNETGVRETFPTNGLKVRWRVALGHGFSSPIIAGGRVVVMDTQLQKPKAAERVLCFDEVSGRPLWNYAHDVTYPDWAFTPGQEKGPVATPLTREGKVYVLGSVGHVFCFDARKGGVLWQKDLGKKYDPAQVPMWAASPLLEGELLIVPGGRPPQPCLVAFNKNSGRQAWEALNEPASYSSPIVLTAGGTRQLIVWTEQSVSSLDPATGKLLWRERFVAGNDMFVASPIGSDERLFVGGAMLQLTSDKPGATLLWPATGARKVLSDTSTGLLRGELLFSVRTGGPFVCFDAATGQQLWTTNGVTDQKSGASVHIVAHGDSVLLFNERGELVRARLSATGYHEISRVKVIAPTYDFGGRKVAWAAPAFANRHLFVRSDQELICASLEP